MKDLTAEQREKIQKKGILKSYLSMISLFKQQTEIERLRSSKNQEKGLIVKFSDQLWLECFYDPIEKTWSYYKFKPLDLAKEKRIDGKLKDKDFRNMIKSLYK